MAALARIASGLDAQGGHLFPWVPVCLGTGIGAYFALGSEPGAGAWVALAATALGLAVLARRLTSFRVVPVALILVILGVGLAAWRTHGVAAPVLGFHYYGPVEGRVVGIDRSASDAVRLTLDDVVLERTPPWRTPDRVRVSLHGEQGFVELGPGMRVMMTANLSAPGGPVEPGSFDFRRRAWFEGIGAVGYTRSPVLAVAAARGGRELAMTRLRSRISSYMRATLPGDVGGFAAAVTTGDRSGLSRQAQEQMRAANTAHILSISGLHMGLLTAFVFAAVRYGLATVPALALRLPLKKIAAVVALGAGTFYLLMAEPNVATERSYIMAAVMLVAVLLDRRAISLRTVAIAAVLVLVRTPEALLDPGFQMSFAATVALVGGFAWARGLPRWPGPKWTLPAVSLFLTSVVAGAATAPFGAAHFNMVSHYGLLANMVSVPLVGLVVVPGIVASACLAPLGLGWVGLYAAAPGLAWILRVAEWTAGLDGSVSHVVAPGTWTLPLIAMGGLVLILWQGRGRLVGVVPVALAFVLWTQAERPDVLVSAGALVGVMTEEGRALSKPRGEGFAAESWLENDGDSASQEAAAARAGFEPAPEGALRVAGRPIYLVTGRSGAERAERLCVRGVIVVTSAETPRGGPCTLLDSKRLEAAGGIALYDDSDGPRIVAVNDATGHRPWSGPAALERPGASRLATLIQAGLAPILDLVRPG